MTSVADWKAAGSYFDFKGHQIFFREDGHVDAPVILLVHGLPSSSWDYDLMWPELVKRYRVLTLELIPHADVVELEGIGHYPQVQAPKEVLKAYFEFRERTDRA